MIHQTAHHHRHARQQLEPSSWSVFIARSDIKTHMGATLATGALVQVQYAQQLTTPYLGYGYELGGNGLGLSGSAS